MYGTYHRQQVDRRTLRLEGSMHRWAAGCENVRNERLMFQGQGNLCNSLKITRILALIPHFMQNF